MLSCRLTVALAGIPALLFASACSTDMTGLGAYDSGTNSGGGGTVSGSGGRPGTGGVIVPGTGGHIGSGGVIGTGGVVGAGGVIGSGGTSQTGGRSGTGGVGTGGIGTGGRGGTGGAASGGAGSGGRVGTGGTAGNATGGRGGAGTSGGAGGGNAATGGNGTGGGATGGTSTGGTTGTGGRNGSGGRSGGTGGSGPAMPECVTANDCYLVNDCCTCAAFPEGVARPSCSQLCLQSKCAQQNLPGGEIACVAGRCVAGFNCDSSHVSCDQPTPACPAGQVPGINANGTCFSGGCVPTTECRRVTSCAVCGPEQACVVEVIQGGTRAHCVTVPPVCQGAATCGCLGPSTCVPPTNTCTDFSGIRGLACSCPNC